MGWVGMGWVGMGWPDTLGLGWVGLGWVGLGIGGCGGVGEALLMMLLRVPHAFHRPKQVLDQA
jgi:hypothetical protein